jgi:restriction system protein
MAVPDFQSFFKPLLDLATDGQEHSIQEAREVIAKQMALPQADPKEPLPSGIQTKFENRVAWAKSYFIQAKVFDASRRSFFRITSRGMELHKAGHKRIDIKILNQYPEFFEFHRGKKGEETEVEPTKETPEELLQKSYESIQSDLAGQIVQRITHNSPKFFERLVVDLMVAMGYGGSRVDAGKSIGGSGDEGIDGIIKEDKLGLDLVYIQAKRWEGTVGRPELQKFVGALHGKRAKKGVFITTAKFSEDAKKYVEAIDPKVILIDGRMLAELMIDHGLGTTTTATYHIKRIDSDYFAED